MPEPQIIATKTFYFRREGVGCSQTVRPALSNSDSIGNVLSVSGAAELEEAIFEKSVGNRIVDYDAVNQRDREVLTITCNELSEVYHELRERVSVSLAGGAATYTPGGTITTKGWARLIYTDDAGNNVQDAYYWCKLDLPSFDLPHVGGHVQATFTLRKLYSAENTGTFASIA